MEVNGREVYQGRVESWQEKKVSLLLSKGTVVRDIVEKREEKSRWAEANSARESPISRKKGNLSPTPSPVQ